MGQSPVCKQEVTGSIPVGSTSLRKISADSSSGGVLARTQVLCTLLGLVASTPETDNEMIAAYEAAVSSCCDRRETRTRARRIGAALREQRADF